VAISDRRKYYEEVEMPNAEWRMALEPREDASFVIRH
jgi:hypothetical protein